MPTNGALLESQDHAHLIHPYLPLDNTQRLIFEKGRGAKLWDISGREYIDAVGGGLCVSQIGHGRTELADVAKAQMEKLEYFTIFNEYSHEPAIKLAEKLSQISPEGLDHVFFANSGSEANDAAYMIARFFHHENGAPEKTWILSRRNAYHGKTLGSGTTTGFARAKVGLGPEMPNVAHLTPPHPYQEINWVDGEDTTSFYVQELENMIAEIGSENIAAFVGEPIMGVAGLVLPHSDYWTRIHAVLKKHGILLIFDEVVTAFGRVGEWFAANTYSVVPDMIVTAKGITSGYQPMGAVLMSKQIANKIRVQRGFPFGFTYSGHPVASAVALKNIEIIENEGLVEQSRAKGASMLEKLKPLEELEVVGEVRGLGLGIGIELVEDSSTRVPLRAGQAQIVNRIREEGVLVRISGENTLTMYPPFVITDEEADRIVDAVSKVLRQLRPDGSFTA